MISALILLILLSVNFVWLFFIREFGKNQAPVFFELWKGLVFRYE